MGALLERSVAFKHSPLERRYVLANSFAAALEVAQQLWCAIGLEGGLMYGCMGSRRVWLDRVSGTASAEGMPGAVASMWERMNGVLRERDANEHLQKTSAGSAVL
jgi:hypothetical protein